VPDVAEQRARGAGEVVAVGGEPGDDRLACAQHGGMVARGRGSRRSLGDVGSKLPINGSTELVHSDYSSACSPGRKPGQRAHPHPTQTPVSQASYSPRTPLTPEQTAAP